MDPGILDVRKLTVCVTFERDSIGEDEANYRTRYHAGHIRWANRQAKAPDFLTIHTPVHPVKKQIFSSNGGHNLIIFKDVPLIYGFSAKAPVGPVAASMLNGYLRSGGSGLSLPGCAEVARE